MGGLPCAKHIIDQSYALVQQMSCMNASILLYSDTTQPTDAMEDEFRDATNAVAAIAAKIERYVRQGA